MQKRIPSNSNYLLQFCMQDFFDHSWYNHFDRLIWRLIREISNMKVFRLLYFPYDQAHGLPLHVRTQIIYIIYFFEREAYFLILLKC